jgi:hypothetical protein
MKLTPVQEFKDEYDYFAFYNQMSQSEKRMFFQREIR